MGEVPEGRSENDEERGRHDESVLVHGKVMVNTMKQEMESDEDPVIGKVTGNILSVIKNSRKRVEAGF